MNKEELRDYLKLSYGKDSYGLRIFLGKLKIIFLIHGVDHETSLPNGTCTRHGIF